MSKEENKMQEENPVIITYNDVEYRRSDLNEEQMALAAKLNVAGRKLNRLQEAFMNIAMAKVSTSAHEAREMNYLRNSDRIVLNRSQIISEAKKEAIALAEAGYVQNQPRKDVWVEGKQALALFKAGITSMRMGNYISDHDALIGNKLAYVIAGGDLDKPQMVSEQYLLDLERGAFLSLTGEAKTQERIASLLGGGKPVRN